MSRNVKQCDINHQFQICISFMCWKRYIKFVTFFVFSIISNYCSFIQIATHQQDIFTLQQFDLKATFLFLHLVLNCKLPVYTISLVLLQTCQNKQHQSRNSSSLVSIIFLQLTYLDLHFY